MGGAENKCIDYPNPHPSPRHLNQLRIDRGRIHEMVLVKELQLIATDAASHGWNVVHVGFRHHGGHHRVDVSRAELIVAMHLPQDHNRSRLKLNGLSPVTYRIQQLKVLSKLPRQVLSRNRS
jgi:hypothetical protein